MAQIALLLQQGFKEICLTGIDACSYEPSFSGLVAAVLKRFPNLPSLQFLSLIHICQERREQVKRMGAVDLEIKEAAVRSKLVMEAKHICKKFGEREIVKDFSLRVLKGNRIGIVGPNGSGKTTLVKLLTQHLAPDSGFVRLGKNLEMAYFDQNREMLAPDKTLWRTLCGEGDHIYVRGHYRCV